MVRVGLGCALGLWLTAMAALAIVPPPSSWTLGPGNLFGNVWMGLGDDGNFYFADNPGMDGFQEACVWESDGEQHVSFTIDGHSYSWSMDSVIAALAGDCSDGSSSSSRKSSALPNGLGNDMIMMNGHNLLEIQRAQTEAFNAINLALIISGPQEYRLQGPKGSWDESRQYLPPGEVLREWGADVQAEAVYGEKSLRLPGSGARVLAKTAGTEVAVRFSQDRLLVATGLSWESTSLGGIYSLLDHETWGLRGYLRYRALMQAVEQVDLDFFGGASLLWTRYEREIPGLTKDTLYLAPGLGLAVGRDLSSLGYLRALYFYQPHYALGSGRRQATGDRYLQVHSVGLSWNGSLYAGESFAGWLALRGLYQYTPGLPVGYDRDGVATAAELVGQWGQWSARVTADHVMANRNLGNNWKLGLAGYYSF